MSGLNDLKKSGCHCLWEQEVSALLLLVFSARNVTTEYIYEQQTMYKFLVVLTHLIDQTAPITLFLQKIKSVLDCQMSLTLSLR